MPADAHMGKTHTHLDFEQLFREHYPYVVRLAASVSGDAEMARDIAQEVFIAAHLGLRTFRGEAAPRTWLYRITLRVAGRHAVRHRRHAGSALNLDELAGGETADSTAALTELVTALGKLSLASRTVLSLVAIEGLAHEEAAEVLGIPVGTVWSRLHAARRELAQAMAQ
jgi:RNA polymerase sigma-70 factor, ECF subfamily